MAKYFKATLIPKKLHPESPEEIVLHACEFKTQKEFSNFCLGELGEVDDVKLWYAPKIEKITVDEYNEAMEALESQANDSAIEGELVEGNPKEPALESEPSPYDSFYWFQYTPNNPIVIRIQLNAGHLTASYKFKHELFVKIDKKFEKQENAVACALGMVIDDCMESPTKEHMTIIKAIGNRGESAIPEALMSSDDVIKMCTAAMGDDTPSDTKEIEPLPGEMDTKPWENNPDIEHQKLYGAIVDIIARYNGEKIPSAARCYESLIGAIPEKYRDHDDLENKLISSISDITNPHNFTNTASSVQIVMRALPQTNAALTAQQRLSQKFSEPEAAVREPEAAVREPEAAVREPEAAVREPEKSQPTKEIESFDNQKDEKDSIDPIDDLGIDFGDNPKKVEKAEKPEKAAKPEKSDFEKLVDSYNEKIEGILPGEVLIIDDMPNEVYHACMGISSSQIKDAMKSMQFFDAKYNQDLIDKPTGAHFDVGNVFHSICLEPDLTSKEYICEPSGDDVPQKPSDAQAKKYGDWLKLGSPEKKENPKAYPTDLMFERCGWWSDWYAANDGLCPVGHDDWSIAENMAKSALNDDDSKRLLSHPSRKCERSYFKHCEETGMIIKARPDLELGRIISDLKSISLRGEFDETYLISALRKEVLNRRYDLSAAMYLDICDKSQFVWIFTNKQKGYHWTATVLASAEILERGRTQYLEYKRKIAESYNSGIWPKPQSIQSKKNLETGKLELPSI
ncbi:coil containing protein [Vibrio phage 1.259.O._10N.286.48.F4]|nr:coil containing protein [Vibrio phage 1.259.O._10N.286.48.F4]